MRNHVLWEYIISCDTTVSTLKLEIERAVYLNPPNYITGATEERQSGSHYG
jgi:hypothetical protein